MYVYVYLCTIIYLYIDICMYISIYVCVCMYMYMYMKYIRDGEIPKNEFELR